MRDRRPLTHIGMLVSFGDDIQDLSMDRRNMHLVWGDSRSGFQAVWHGRVRLADFDGDDVENTNVARTRLRRRVIAVAANRGRHPRVAELDDGLRGCRSRVGVTVSLP